MRPTRFTADRLQVFLQHNQVATLSQLKTALGTAVDGTVFRKLATLPYRTSYSIAAHTTRSTPRSLR